jgi:hemerythrin superfamily protein
MNLEAHVFARDMNIITLQRQDHERMERLLQSYEAHGPARLRIYSQIVDLVTTHAFAEETVLFPAARRLLRELDGVTHEIEAKHQRVNDLMVEMQRMKPGELDFEARAAELFSVLRADARQEEDVLLVRLAAETDERHLRSIGATWATARRTAPNRPHPHVSRRPPGNVLAGLPLALTDRVRNLVERLRHKRTA